jgi:hypothetical protein
MASRRPEHSLYEGRQPAMTMPQRQQHKPDQRNDDVHVKGDAGEEDAASGDSIDNLLDLRAQLPGVLAEFVA